MHFIIVLRDEIFELHLYFIATHPKLLHQKNFIVQRMIEEQQKNAKINTFQTKQYKIQKPKHSNIPSKHHIPSPNNL